MFFFFCRGYLGIEDMIIVKSCWFFLVLIGFIELVNSEGIYRYNFLMVVDGGEVILILDVGNNLLIFDVDDIII